MAMAREEALAKVRARGVAVAWVMAALETVAATAVAAREGAKVAATAAVVLGRARVRVRGVEVRAPAERALAMGAGEGTGEALAGLMAPVHSAERRFLRHRR